MYIIGEFTNRRVVTRREVHGQTQQGFKPEIRTRVQYVNIYIHELL